MSFFLRINMTEKKTSYVCAPKEYIALGGRGITSKLIHEEVPPDCEPLGLYNKIIIAPGLFSGSKVPCSCRLSIGAKSPLTGGIKESNAGGTAAQRLGRLGIKAIIIEGKTKNKEMYVLRVGSSKAELIREPDILGKDNYEACEIILKKYGKDVSVIIAGPAAEMGYPNSTIALTDAEGIPARQCARGGLGNVMVSRGLKAIIIEGDGKSIEPIDKNSFKMINFDWTKELIKTKKALTDYGTAVLVNLINNLGGLATRNYTSGSFENADKICGESLATLIKKRGGHPTHGCHKGCPIRCSNIYVDETGKNITSSLEFETIALMGSNLGISDLDVIAQIDRFCDDFGMDTIELGGTLGVAMEAGIINFGNASNVFNLLAQIRHGTILGRLLGQGTEISGKTFGVERIPTVKGQCIAAYDPRALKGTGVTYATSPMGGDHTAGNCLPGRVGYREETQDKLGNIGDMYQVEISEDLQVMTTVFDVMGLCILIGPSDETMHKIGKLISAFIGVNHTKEDVINLGKEILNLEFDFNQKAGIINNNLPEFFYTEPLPPTGSSFSIDTKNLKLFRS